MLRPVPIYGIGLLKQYPINTCQKSRNKSQRSERTNSFSKPGFPSTIFRREHIAANLKLIKSFSRFPLP